MVTMNKFKQIRELKNLGHSDSEIARKLKINRKTVAKYFKSNTPPKYKTRPSSTRKDPTEGLQSRIDELVDDDKMLAIDVYELLKEEGYQGSERTVRRRVAQIRGQKPVERFFEQKYTPGEQSQFDFKEKILIPFMDGEHSIYLHFGTLPSSDHFGIRAYPRKNFECFMEGIHYFFEDIGGMTKNIRIDNLSPCVAKVHKGSRRTYTDSFQRAIDYYGFEVLPCRPGKGSDKGDVERDIRTHARRIKRLIENQKLKFKNFDELNCWLTAYRDKRVNDTIGEKFNEEKKKLLILPKKEESILYKVEELTASSYGAVKLGDYYYSIPDNVIGQKCQVVATAFEVKIYRKSPKLELVATHSRSDGDSILLEHILPSLVRKPAAMIRWSHKKVLFPSEVSKKFYKQLQNKQKESAQRNYLKTLNLIQHTELSEIAAAVELVVGMEAEDLYEEVRELILGQRRPDNVIYLKNYQRPLEVDLKGFDDLIPKE